MTFQGERGWRPCPRRADGISSNAAMTVDLVDARQSPTDPRATNKVGVPGLTDTDKRDGGRRLLCLPQRDAAVHRDPLTGNVPGSVAGQERRELPDVLQGLLSSQRH